MKKELMLRAIELAAKGDGKTSPNPCVGAVIVKGGQIIAEGWHKKAGEKHAEIIAIEKIMNKSGIVTMVLDPMLFRNATLYVTLEPCFHHGQTLPCVEKIVEAGFKKVYVGMIDPDKRVNGKSIRLMRKNGIKVEVCKIGTPLSDKVRKLNQPFIKLKKTGLPFVTLKSATTLDGKIATSTGDSKWITSESARMDARIERSKCDAVMVGAGTVTADNPTLFLHEKFKAKSFLKVVVDGKLTLSLDKKIFKDENVFVAHSDLASKSNKEKYKKANIASKSFGKDEVSIKQLLKYLGSKGLQHVFVEGGGMLNGGVFDSGMIDRVLFYVAPKLIGGEKSIPVIGGEGIKKISKAKDVFDVKMESIGDDLKIEGLVNFY